MKRIVRGSLIFTLFFNIFAVGSEQNWLQSKISSFAKTMLARHTYEYNSFEHKRDRAFLCLLPAYISQAVLAKQRTNMINFLENNKDNALEGVRKYFNVDEEQWGNILQTFEKEHAFNLNAMRQPDTALGHQDETLPVEYIHATKQKTARYGINSKNLNIEKTTGKCFASTREERPSSEKYDPATIEFNTYYLSQCNHHKSEHSTDHELTHLIRGDSIQESIILDEITKKSEVLQKANLLLKQSKELEDREEQLYNKKLSLFERLFDNEWDEISKQRRKLNLEFSEINKQFVRINAVYDDYLASDAKAIFQAAKEKTADTYVPCIDKQAAKNAFMAINSMTDAGLASYPDNYNDLQVIDANWQTSQVIADFEQLKKIPQQKVSAFAHSLRSVVTG